MDFISNQKPQIEEMLKTLGIASIDELFADIPASLLLPPPSKDDGLSEWEGMRLIREMAALNTFSNYKSYLGAGAYEHHIPQIVPAICSKSEFLTSYTPYQPEASQGMLQAIFEFQTAICALTMMDAANASVYDGASACAEAMLMALRIQKNKTKLLMAETLHPHYQEVVKQYLSTHDVELLTIPYKENGQLDMNFIKKTLDTNTAAILTQSPNFFGLIEDVAQVAGSAKQAGALTIVSANPLAYGLYKPCGVLGADIAVGDCQPFGIPLQFGGPYVGYMACKEPFIRQLPGRIVGQTSDKQGRTGYVLTLQAREQHIRREKATSNICTNQALAALASLIALLWYGKEGVGKLALMNFQRASYLKENLRKLPGFEAFDETPIFNEFVIKFPKPITEVQRHFRQAGIEPGLNLEPYYPKLKQSLLIAVTETKTLDDLDNYIHTAKTL